MPSPDGRATFDRILNFRDIGAHVNYLTGQELLRTGVLYRSARPDAATASDRQRLIDEFKFKTIIDLRTPTEHIESARKHAADIPTSPLTPPDEPVQPLRISELGYRDVNFNGSSYSKALIWQLGYAHIAKLFGLYALGYRKEAIGVLGKNVMAERGLHGLAIDSLTYCKAEVKAVFDILSDSSSYPVVVHCTQGKDRTGLVVLLLLLLCDVPPKAIREDYRLSESELAPEREEKLAEVRSIGLPDSFADCPEDWTEEVCAHIAGAFGGVEQYLLSCGVNLDQQRQVRSILLVE